MIRDAWEVLAERRDPRRPWAPHRLEYKYLSGWTIVAEEIPLVDGSAPYDVYAIYTCPVGGRVGERIPAGPNLHVDPKPEIGRLVLVVA